MEYENNIDWKKLFHGIEYYEKVGYTMLNTDWIVEREFTEVTKPIDIVPVSYGEVDLVGSCEQTFIKMMSQGVIKNGSFMGLTPCFRNEPIVDLLHRKYFMKLELIVVGGYNTWSENLGYMLNHSLDFFSKYLPVDMIQTDEEQYDIIDIKNGIELGSYGIRHWKDLSWVYGTGIAEPRLSTTIEILKTEI